MFDAIRQNASSNVDTICSVLKINDNLREILFSPDDSGRKILAQHEKLTSLLKNIPQRKDWQICDHCTAVTQLYAVYESFVEKLILEWLQVVPNLFPNYSDLEPKIQNAHREGIGRLLIELNKNRFKELTAEKVVQGFLAGVTGSETYELLPEAFLSQDQNLRQEVLEKLFADVGINKVWSWLKKHREIKYFIEEIRGDQSTVEAELKRFIDYRNGAAHGGVDEILTTQELLDLGVFVKALCNALAELVTYQIILRKSMINRAKQIGKVIEWYPKSRAAVVQVKECTLSIEDGIWLISEANSLCQLAIIQSIRIDDNAVDQQEIISEVEVGLQFDLNAKTGMSLYLVE
jgi:hypothetical protein